MAYIPSDLSKMTEPRGDVGAPCGVGQIRNRKELEGDHQIFKFQTASEGPFFKKGKNKHFSLIDGPCFPRREKPHTHTYTQNKLFFLFFLACSL